MTFIYIVLIVILGITALVYKLAFQSVCMYIKENCTDLQKEEFARYTRTTLKRFFKVRDGD